ncbi:hypothetical protein RB195_002552 [Necator americanus]|uniref:Uncharacterized protein n=1 Tax=Necator americanus TaxID=51031 RepID=A0ABR1DKZ7_NECAM
MQVSSPTCSMSKCVFKLFYHGVYNFYRSVTCNICESPTTAMTTTMKMDPTTSTTQSTTQAVTTTTTTQSTTQAVTTTKAAERTSTTSAATTLQTTMPMSHTETTLKTVESTKPSTMDSQRTSRASTAETSERATSTAPLTMTSTRPTSMAPTTISQLRTTLHDATETTSARSATATSTTTLSPASMNSPGETTKSTTKLASESTDGNKETSTKPCCTFTAETTSSTEEKSTSKVLYTTGTDATSTLKTSTKALTTEESTSVGSSVEIGTTPSTDKKSTSKVLYTTGADGSSTLQISAATEKNTSVEASTHETMMKSSTVSSKTSIVSTKHATSDLVSADETSRSTAHSKSRESSITTKQTVERTSEETLLTTGPGNATTADGTSLSATSHVSITEETPTVPPTTSYAKDSSTKQSEETALSDYAVSENSSPTTIIIHSSTVNQHSTLVQTPTQGYTETLSYYSVRSSDPFLYSTEGIDKSWSSTDATTPADIATSPDHTEGQSEKTVISTTSIHKLVNGTSVQPTVVASSSDFETSESLSRFGSSTDILQSETKRTLPATSGVSPSQATFSQSVSNLQVNLFLKATYVEIDDVGVFRGKHKAHSSVKEEFATSVTPEATFTSSDTPVEDGTSAGRSEEKTSLIVTPEAKVTSSDTLVEDGTSAGRSEEKTPLTEETLSEKAATLLSLPSESTTVEPPTSLKEEFATSGTPEASAASSDTPIEGRTSTGTLEKRTSLTEETLSTDAEAETTRLASVSSTVEPPTSVEEEFRTSVTPEAEVPSSVSPVKDKISTGRTEEKTSLIVTPERTVTSSDTLVEDGTSAGRSEEKTSLTKKTLMDAGTKTAKSVSVSRILERKVTPTSVREDFSTFATSEADVTSSVTPVENRISTGKSEEKTSLTLFADAGPKTRFASPSVSSTAEEGSDCGNLWWTINKEREDATGYVLSKEGLEKGNYEICAGFVETSTCGYVHVGDSLSVGIDGFVGNITQPIDEKLTLTVTSNTENPVEYSWKCRIYGSEEFSENIQSSNCFHQESVASIDWVSGSINFHKASNFFVSTGVYEMEVALRDTVSGNEVKMNIFINLFSPSTTHTSAIEGGTRSSVQEADHVNVTTPTARSRQTATKSSGQTFTSRTKIRTDPTGFTLSLLERANLSQSLQNVMNQLESTTLADNPSGNELVDLLSSLKPAELAPIVNALLNGGVMINENMTTSQLIEELKQHMNVTNEALAEASHIFLGN